MRKILLLFLGFILLSFTETSIISIEETPMQYESVEIKPLFPGGISEFMKFVMDNYVVPDEDEDGHGETGVLEASIVIGSDGKVKQVNILKNVGNAGAQIKKIVEKSPVWKPGKDKGVNVPVIYHFSVTIK
ncbi:MAG: energy transducer TonB [Limnohabitans sp.]|nr:energy transducer TonB [Limnohabitans sp.]